MTDVAAVTREIAVIQNGRQTQIESQPQVRLRIINPRLIRAARLGSAHMRPIIGLNPTLWLTVRASLLARRGKRDGRILTQCEFSRACVLEALGRRDPDAPHDRKFSA
jgi:hypothetical protein